MRTRFTSLLVIAVACGHSHSGSGSDAALPDGSRDGAIGDAPVGHGTPITVTLKNRPNNAASFNFVVAYQDGASAWQAAPAPAGDVYSFEVTSAAWGFAWTCIAQGAGNIGVSERDVNVYLFATSERTSLLDIVPPRCSDRGGQNVALGGTISNPPIGGVLEVTFGLHAAIAARGVGLGNTTYAMETPKGAHDLIVGHFPTAIFGTASAADTAFVRRDLVVNGATMADVDYASAQQTRTANVTVNGVSGGAKIDVSTTLASAGGTVLTFVHQTGGSANQLATVGLADSLAAAGDVYDQQIDVVDGSDVVSVQSWVSTIDNQDYPAPSSLGGAVTTVTTTSPYPILDTTWSPYPDAIGYVWQGTQLQSGSRCGAPLQCTVVWTIDASPGYVGVSPEATMPDLSAIAGWDPRLELVVGANVDGTLSAHTSTRGAGDFPQLPIAPAGTQRVNVGSTWSATP